MKSFTLNLSLERLNLTSSYQNWNYLLKQQKENGGDRIFHPEESQTLSNTMSRDPPPPPPFLNAPYREGSRVVKVSYIFTLHSKLPE